MLLAENASIAHAHLIRRAIASFVELPAVCGEPYQLVLGAHELIANAILHGSAPIELAIASTETVSVVAVRDSHPSLPSVHGEAHHGLWILSQMTAGAVMVLPIDTGGKWIGATLRPAPSCPN
jgi:hypothetical protein